MMTAKPGHDDVTEKHDGVTEKPGHDD